MNNFWQLSFSHKRDILERQLSLLYFWLSGFGLREVHPVRIFSVVLTYRRRIIDLAASWLALTSTVY